MKQKLPNFVAIIGLSIVLISGTIDLDNLFNYANQSVPNYITKDNTPQNNEIDDKIATLGRVLFYDKKLSANNTIACASCHKQEKAFGDDATVSVGFESGTTGRHSMRLINSRFSDEVKFFWDERAASLEIHTTQPIQDHVEMGFSGTNGQEDINDLITKLSAIDYYQELFKFAFGDETITENRMQLAMAQFVRSIQSFDSKYDVGRDQVNNPNDNFPNYTTQENQGKTLFLRPPNAGGAGCAGCHRPDEFDIDPNSRNNGIISVAGDNSATDLTNFRAPSLRDVFNPDGNLNGPLMHDGSLTTMLDVINHYNAIPNSSLNADLDNRLRPGGNPQQLNLTENEKSAIVAFLRTLTGTDVYTNEKWSNPFDVNGNITLNGSVLAIESEVFGNNIKVFPNPVQNNLNISIADGNYNISIYNVLGAEVLKTSISSDDMLDVNQLKKGIYFLLITDQETCKTFKKKFIKN